MLRAAANDTGTRILSTPRLATLNHAPAEILVGSNIPVKTGEALVGGNGQSEPFTTIERKDIGIVLKVTPHINADDDVTLDIEQTVESLAPSSSTDTDLVTNKRQLKTRVRVENETVLVLGGLSSQENNEVVSKVPVLGDIPLMGALFRNTRNETVNRHLMVFIQPRLITDPDVAADVSSEAMAQFGNEQSSATLDFDSVPSPAQTTQAYSTQNDAANESEWEMVQPSQAADTQIDATEESSLQKPPVQPVSVSADLPQSEKESIETRDAVADAVSVEPEPVYGEETIELDDQQAHITRSQGVRSAFVAPSSAPSMEPALQPKREASPRTKVTVQTPKPEAPKIEAKEPESKKAEVAKPKAQTPKLSNAKPQAETVQQPAPSEVQQAAVERPLQQARPVRTPTPSSASDYQ